MNTVSRYMMALCLFTSLVGQPIHAAQNSWISGAWAMGTTLIYGKDYQLKLKNELAEQTRIAEEAKRNALLDA